MKLLLCKNCWSVFGLRKEAKFCECGASGGRYLEDGLQAVICGNAATVLGINNSDLFAALRREGKGSRENEFGAWVMLDEADIPTIHRDETLGG